MLMSIHLVHRNINETDLTDIQAVIDGPCKLTMQTAYYVTLQLRKYALSAHCESISLYVYIIFTISSTFITAVPLQSSLRSKCDYEKNNRLFILRYRSWNTIQWRTI